MIAAMPIVKDLRTESSWDPVTLLASNVVWPGESAEQLIDNVGTRLVPGVVFSQGTPVVSPVSIDPLLGGIRVRDSMYQGGGFLVGGRPSNLQAFDVLVPARANVPALMIQDRLAGASVSDGFVAYRFSNSDDAYWVWAVLSSVTGQRMRAIQNRGSYAFRPTRQEGFRIPWPSEEVRAALSGKIAAIEAVTHSVAEEEAVTTWWSTADLRDVEWRLALVTPNPGQLFDGVPLADLATVVRPGGRVLKESLLAAPTNDSLPVITGGNLAGRPFDSWTEALEQAVIVEPNDILISRLGKRAHARLAGQRAVITSAVLYFRPKDPSQAEAIVAFLNGQHGYSLRQMFRPGSEIPHVTVFDLANMHIPESTLHAEQIGHGLPVAEQLEKLLWNP